MSFLDDYEPVENRIRAFWDDHPQGRIATHMVAHTDGDYIVKAFVYRKPEGEADATGYAHDSAAQLPANMKASALEVCETSAIGRALANLGYAPKGQRPSREEMSKASAGGAKGSSPAVPQSEGVGWQADGEDVGRSAPSDLHEHAWVYIKPGGVMQRCVIDNCSETRRHTKDTG